MASINTVDSYTDYFRQKAIADPDLQHNPLGEDGDAPIGSMHFNTWSVDDIVTGINTQLGFPALLLEIYETNLQVQGVYDVKGTRQGAFTILTMAQTLQNQKARMAAYSQTEIIMMRILQTMWDDHYGENASRCTAQFEALDFDNMQLMPVGPVQNDKYGWRCEFTFKISKLIKP
jgi:hypothetical protein